MALHDQDDNVHQSAPPTRYGLGIMQFKDSIAEGGHWEGAKVDAVRRCPYPPER